MRREELFSENTSDETNLLNLLLIDDHSSIKEECRMLHLVVHCLVIQGLELRPFSTKDNSLGILRCSDRILSNLDGREQIGDILCLDLWIVDMDDSLLLKEISGNVESRGFSDVTSISLESETKNQNFLSTQIVVL